MNTYKITFNANFGTYTLQTMNGDYVRYLNYNKGTYDLVLISDDEFKAPENLVKTDVTYDLSKADFICRKSTCSFSINDGERWIFLSNIDGHVDLEMYIKENTIYIKCSLLKEFEVVEYNYKPLEDSLSHDKFFRVSVADGGWFKGAKHFDFDTFNECKSFAGRNEHLCQFDILEVECDTCSSENGEYIANIRVKKLY